MRIVLTGGGSGGHFYPLIAVAEAIEQICKERVLLEPEMYYVGPKPFDLSALQEHDIQYLPSPAGPKRIYSSILNVVSALQNVAGIIKSLYQLFQLYPDVIFSTGGYAAFPTLYAARLLKIPVVIYDADAMPGRVSLWSSKFAQWIGVAHRDAAARFPPRVLDRVAHIGHPIRSEIQTPTGEGGHQFLHLDPDAPTLFILGGSLGARAINGVILDALPELLSRFNVVRQAGSANLDEVTKISSVVLKDSQFKDRYKLFGLLNVLALRMAAGISSIILSRAGSGAIFEIASWGVPAILVPIPEDVSRDQTENAFSYARAGGGVVIEQRNLTPHILVAEVRRLMDDPVLQKKMRDAAAAFAKRDAAQKVAVILLRIGIEHEPV